MEFLDSKLQQYVDNHTAPEPVLLQELNRETNANVLMPRMLSGHIQGRILAMFSHMIRPDRVLEIGTYTGYSALCLAEGLTKDGIIHTIDINDELEDMVRAYFKKSPFNEHIMYHLGNALEIIPTLEEEFDLVFIDADKDNYSNYYDMVIGKIRKGGIIIADNVLWSGKVLEAKKVDKDTQALIDFNSKVHNDKQVENVLFPVRDGLMVLRKI